MKAERVENKSDKARVMELEAQIFEAERARSIQSWRENALEAELAEAEDRGGGLRSRGGEHVQLLAEKWWYFITLVYSVGGMVG